MVFHPLVQHVRAHLALDEFEGTGAHHLLPVEFLAPGIPARLALHRQFAVGRDVIDKLRHHLLEVEHDLVFVNGLHALFDFPGHLLYAVCLRHPQHIPPEARSSRYGLRLGDEGDRVAHVSGGELSPILVEFDALA